MSFWMISIALVIVSAMPLAAKEFVIFDDELVCGTLTVHDGGFEISNEGAFEGKKCLSRELIAGEWAWITGIEDMGLDLTGIEFDDAFIEFYIDSENLVLDYVELRLGGQGWNPDCGAIIQTDGADGYEQVKILLSDFEVQNLGEARDLDAFTGGTNKIYKWSIGFSPAGDTTVRVDNLRIADSDEKEMQAVKPADKLTTSWAAVKSSL